MVARRPSKSARCRSSIPVTAFNSPEARGSSREAISGSSSPILGNAGGSGAGIGAAASARRLRHSAKKGWMSLGLPPPSTSMMDLKLGFLPSANKASQATDTLSAVTSLSFPLSMTHSRNTLCITAILARLFAGVRVILSMSVEITDIGLQITLSAMRYLLRIREPKSAKPTCRLKGIDIHISG